MEELVEIKQTDWTDIKPVWAKELWPLRPLEEITPISSMMFMGGYNLDIKKNRPYFWKLETSQGNLVGTISGFITAPGEFRSRGIWISENYRGLGYSKRLFNQLEVQARYLDCARIWSYPRMDSLMPYLKYGFNTVGSVQDDNDPYGPHIYVEKVL